jgi:predicted TIM-barrel fold metal-dependent hydrolase
MLVPQGKMDEVDVPAAIRSLYFDLAGAAQPVMLDALMKVADPEHLLYGSDYPYTPTPIVAACKDSLEHDPLLADITEDVFSNNARRLFGLDFE